MRNISENVKLIRKAKGVSKTFIAKKLNLTIQGYTHVENGNVSLSAERLKVISDALGISIEVFFDEKLTDNVIELIA